MIGMGSIAKPTLYDDTGLNRDNWIVRKDCPEIPVEMKEITISLDGGDDTGLKNVQLES